MRFSTSLTTILATIGLLVANAAATTFTWDGSAGSAWSNPANWDVGSGYPDDSGDTAIIPSGLAILDLDITVGFLEMQGGEVWTQQYELNIAGSSGLDVQDGALLLVNSGGGVGGTVELSGGGSGHLISGTGTIELSSSGSTFKVSASATLDYSGSPGSIVGLQSSTAIDISTGATFTSKVVIHGRLLMIGTGSAVFNNSGILSSSSGGLLELSSTLNLADVDGAVWEAAGGTLRFSKAHTGNSSLKGDIVLDDSGTLDIDASISLNVSGAGVAYFLWTGGTLDISGGGVTFSYEDYHPSSTCTNPDASGPPYSVGTAASGSC